MGKVYFSHKKIKIGNYLIDALEMISPPLSRIAVQNPPKFSRLKLDLTKETNFNYDTWYKNAFSDNRKK